MRSPPEILPRVCVGPSKSSSQHQGRVNISWDPLPCHLQNGADVTGSGYIIQYTHLSTGVTIRVSSAGCGREVGGIYSCAVNLNNNNIIINQLEAYSIQVAAMNNHGEGSFSDPIRVTLPVSSRCY